MEKVSTLPIVRGLGVFAIAMGVLLMLDGCKQEDLGSLGMNGVVTDARNGTPIPGVSVALDEQVLENGSFNSNFSTAASTVTASNGSYSVDFERKNVVEYRLSLDKAGYFPKEYEINPDNVPLDDAFTQNGSMFTIATVQTRLLNGMPLNSLDQIRFRYLNANEFDCPCCNNDFKVLQGTEVDSTFSCDLYGDFNLKYVYEVTRNDTTITFVDSTYCPAFQTTEILINY